MDFAMGIEGTQIAKDAANIILLDNNFTCIVFVAILAWEFGNKLHDLHHDVERLPNTAFLVLLQSTLLSARGSLTLECTL